MNVIPFVHEGLGNSSYLVDLGDGRALLVDPDRTAARYLALAESRRLRIEAVLEVDPDLPPILADPTELQQVFMNLLANAIQAITPAGRPGRVLVRARASGDLVLAEVEDDGPGIPAAQREQVFEPFFTTKPEGDGTGLGLSIASGIVRELGGRISVRPGASGGACFAIELPAADVTIGRPLSPAVQGALPGVVRRVLDEVRRLASI